MKVKELMSSQVETCAASDDLASAAMVMWRKDCGVVPVVDEENEVQGVITDRDICIAAATRHRRPGEIGVHEAMTRLPYSVRPDDDVRTALDTMRARRVRRVPVVDAKNRLRGMVSINDIILHAHPGTTGSVASGISASDVLLTLQSICSHPRNGRPEREPEPASFRSNGS